MQEALVVRRETHIPAPPSAVFAFLTDPEKILRWMGTEAETEPQPGGLYLVNVTGARFARGWRCERLAHRAPRTPNNRYSPVRPCQGSGPTSRPPATSVSRSR